MSNTALVYQPHEIRNCKYCGKPMERKRLSNGELQAWIHYNRQVYCDRECMKKAFREKPRKAKSWAGIHKIARGVKQKTSCELCSSTKNLDIHHIDGDPSNNSPENLQCLCRSCHIRVHRKKDGCSICGKPIKGCGYCDKHYQRFKKWGDPLLVKRPSGLISLED